MFVTRRIFENIFLIKLCFLLLAVLSLLYGLLSAGYNPIERAFIGVVAFIVLFLVDNSINRINRNISIRKAEDRIRSLYPEEKVDIKELYLLHKNSICGYSGLICNLKASLSSLSDEYVEQSIDDISYLIYADLKLYSDSEIKNFHGDYKLFLHELFDISRSKNLSHLDGCHLFTLKRFINDLESGI